MIPSCDSLNHLAPAVNSLRIHSAILPDCRMTRRGYSSNHATMKKCRKCELEKLLAEFQRCARETDGRNNQCTSCRRKPAYLLTPAELKKRKGQIVRWKLNSFKRNGFTWNPKWSIGTKNWKLRNPARDKSGKLFYNAVRSGKIIRPKICSKCGTCGVIEGHHKDYSKPYDVTWLCKKCHSAEHYRIKVLKIIQRQISEIK